VRGNALQPEFTQSFTTISQDTDPPKINEVIPANGATGVFVTDKIIVFFSEPMNKASVEAGFTLSWTDSNGTKTAGGSFSWSDDNTSFTYTPSGSLRENTTYSIKLQISATDLSGNHMQNIESRTFTTVTQAQIAILYLGPANGSTAVPVTTPVVVDFSKPVNTFTVTANTFKLLLGTTQISGKFEFLNENSRVVFRPDVNLSFSQLYTVKLTTGIQDMSLPTNSSLAASTTSFTTAAKITVPDILYLDPSSGVAGTVVTVAGTGFDPDPAKNKITFNGIDAPVKSATLTSLTTEVPNGAMSGPVEVTVNGTVSDNTMYFYIVPQSLDPCSNLIGNKSTGSGSGHDVDVTEAVSVSGVRNTYAYVTNPELGTVTVINLTTTEALSTIPVGNTPMQIDINPQGTKAYVTNFNSHTVSVIDLTNSTNHNKVIATIPVGIEPYGIVVTPNGKRVYVANYYSGNLSVIDEDPNSGGFDHVVANVSTGSTSSNVAVTADAGMVLVTGEFGLKIVNSNPADKDYNSVIANVSTGSTANDVTATADAGLAIVTTDDGYIKLINLHPENGDYSEAVIANVSTGTKGSGVDASGDNLFVYLTDTEHDQIQVFQIGIGGGGSGTANGSGVTGLTLILHNKIPVKAPVALVISADASKLYVIDKPTVTGNKEISTYAICCGPISPAKALGDLIITIQTMINKGDIPKLRGYALIITLNGALRNYYANRPKLELVDLNAFKVLVTAYIKNKQISTSQGNALLASINAIIAQLNGTKSALGESYSTDNEQSDREIISESRLGVIYPNPSKESVAIDYEIGENKEALIKVQIMVYDFNGKLVSTLVDRMMQQGCYKAVWEGTYNDGVPASYGTYFVRFRAGVKEEVKKIMLIKPH
jgi:YVTN family beta-propeller protein